MKEQTALAIEKFAVTTLDALRAIDRSPGDFRVELQNVTEAKNELINALAEENLTP